MEESTHDPLDSIRKAILESSNRPDVSSLWGAISDKLNGNDGFADELLECYRSCLPGSPQQVSVMRMFVGLHSLAAEDNQGGSSADQIPEADIKAAFTALTGNHGSEKR